MYVMQWLRIIGYFAALPKSNLAVAGAFKESDLFLFLVLECVILRFAVVASTYTRKIILWTLNLIIMIMYPQSTLSHLSGCLFPPHTQLQCYSKLITVVLSQNIFLYLSQFRQQSSRNTLNNSASRFGKKASFVCRDDTAQTSDRSGASMQQTLNCRPAVVSRSLL